MAHRSSFAAPRNSIPICRLYNAVQKIYRSGTDARGGSLSVGRDNRRIIIAASPTRREAGRGEGERKAKRRTQHVMGCGQKKSPLRSQAQRVLQAAKDFWPPGQKY